MTATIARPDPLDRRFSRRVPTRSRGLIKTHGLETPCIVRDRSSGGARLVFERDVQLESAFTLTDATGNSPLQVKLVWIDCRQAGVSFLTPCK